MKSKTVKTIIVLFLVVFSKIATSAEYAVVGDHYPPYQYKEHKKIKGFSYDVLRAVLSMNGDTISTTGIYPWKRALHMLETNQANILISANYGEDRLKFAYYPTEPLVVTPWYLWKRKSEQFKFASLEDLLGKKVGVVQGYAYTDAFWHFVRKHDLYTDNGNYTDDINLSNLNQGFYDVAIAELGNGIYIRDHLGLTNIEPILATPVKQDGLYIIFSKAEFSVEKVDKFSENLVKFKKSPEYLKIYQQYFPL